MHSAASESSARGAAEASPVRASRAFSHAGLAKGWVRDKRDSLPLCRRPERSRRRSDRKEASVSELLVAFISREQKAFFLGRSGSAYALAYGSKEVCFSTPYPALSESGG